MPSAPSFFADLPPTALEASSDSIASAFGDSWEDHWLVRSIATTGIETAIIVYRKKDGRYVVVDGHRRLRAARHLDLETIPCRVHPRLTRAERARIRFEVQDNHRPLSQAEVSDWWKRTRDAVPEPDRRGIENDMLAMRLA